MVEKFVEITFWFNAGINRKSRGEKERMVNDYISEGDY
jgi:hypothetical protein